MILTTKQLALAALILTGSLTGCGRQSAVQTQADVTKAEGAGVRDVADARKGASDNLADANKDLAKTQIEVAHTDAEGVRSVTVAKAEAAYTVSIAQCESKSNDERKACATLAKSTLDAAKATAELTTAAMDPKS